MHMFNNLCFAFTFSSFRVSVKLVLFTYYILCPDYLAKRLGFLTKFQIEIGQCGNRV